MKVNKLADLKIKTRPGEHDKEVITCLVGNDKDGYYFVIPTREKQRPGKRNEGIERVDYILYRGV